MFVCLFDNRSKAAVHLRQLGQESKLASAPGFADTYSTPSKGKCNEQAPTTLVKIVPASRKLDLVY